MAPGMLGGLGAPVWQQVIAPGAGAAWATVIAAAKRRAGLSAAARVRSCYEAGRDGLWPHRWLTAQGVENQVIDSSSIEVPRRARRAKTDRLDATTLVRLLVRVGLGERGVWQEVHVPAPATEAARHVPRTVTMLTRERTRWRNRIHSLLATVGGRLRIDRGFPTRLAAARTWDGAALPAALHARVEVAWRLLQQVETERTALQQQLRTARREGTTPEAACARPLAQLRGVGDRFAWLLATEVCCRDLRNRREVGALTGLTGVPYRSGSVVREQGISRAGVAEVRALAVEAAWLWVQWPPASELTQWFERRFADEGPGQRRRGIVAVARRLVIALWRYHRDGEIPAGAVWKAGVA